MLGDDFKVIETRRPGAVGFSRSGGGGIEETAGCIRHADARRSSSEGKEDPQERDFLLPGED